MRTFTTIALLAAATLTAAAQQEAPTFKATTQIVSVPATVLDGQGRLVPNLDEDQFSVLDRAKQKEVMVYSIGRQSQYSNGRRMVRSQPDRSLRKIAEETGGGYCELKKTDELAPPFTRVAQELHSLYTIGFSPAALDGKEHKLELRMKQAGQVARARKTYIASANRLSTTN